MLGCWGIGLLGYWAIGLLGYWAIGVGHLAKPHPARAPSYAFEVCVHDLELINLELHVHHLCEVGAWQGWGRAWGLV